MARKLGQQDAKEMTVEGSIDMQWVSVLDYLRADFDENTYKSWIKPLALINIEDDRAIMAAPTRFMRNWLMSNFAERIKAAWKTVNDGVLGY